MPEEKATPEQQGIAAMQPDGGNAQHDDANAPQQDGLRQDGAPQPIAKKTIKERFLALFKQFFKFGLVGLSNTAISYGTFALLIYVGAHYEVANIVSFVISVLNSYYWNNKYVFKLGEGQRRNAWLTLAKTFAAYAFTGLFLNSFFLYVEVDVWHISAYIAWFMNLVVSIPVNFFINRQWAFSGKPAKHGENDVPAADGNAAFGAAAAGDAQVPDAIAATDDAATSDSAAPAGEDGKQS